MEPVVSHTKLRGFCILQGYSTLGSQWLKAGNMQNPVLENAIVQSIAQEVGRDAAQVVLRWALQHGQVSHQHLSSPSHRFLLSSIKAGSGGMCKLNTGFAAHASWDHSLLLRALTKVNVGLHAGGGPTKLQAGAHRG